MLKGLLLQSGRLLLAGAFGMKRAEEFHPLVRCLCCFYPLIWMMSFIGFGTDSEWIAWLLSIGMPVLYIIFVIIVRLKNKKKQVISEIDDSEEKTEEQSSEEPGETTVIVEPTISETEDKEQAENLHKKKSTAPYIASIVILSVALVASNTTFYLHNKRETAYLEQRINSYESTIQVLSVENKSNKTKADNYEAINTFLKNKTLSYSSVLHSDDIYVPDRIFINKKEEQNWFYLFNYHGERLSIQYQNDSSAVLMLGKNVFGSKAKLKIIPNDYGTNEVTITNQDTGAYITILIIIV